MLKMENFNLLLLNFCDFCEHDKLFAHLCCTYLGNALTAVVTLKLNNTSFLSSFFSSIHSFQSSFYFMHLALITKFDLSYKLKMHIFQNWNL